MNKKDKTALIVVSALTVFGLVVKLYFMFTEQSFTNAIDYFNLLLYPCIAWYAFEGYKKPHGNSLKWIILLYVLLLLPGIARNTEKGLVWMNMLRVITMLFIAYMCGRLERIQQNKYLTVLVLVLLLINPVCKAIQQDESFLFAFLNRATPVITWVDLCSAYFIRYRQHKEAGLADK